MRKIFCLGPLDLGLCFEHQCALKILLFSSGHDSQDYRPAFLDHFEKKESEEKGEEVAAASLATNDEAKKLPSGGNLQLQKQLEQIAGRPVQQQQEQQQQQQDGSGGGGEASAAARFQKSLLEGDLDFLKYLSYEELTSRMSNLDQEMEKEIDDLRRRFDGDKVYVVVVQIVKVNLLSPDTTPRGSQFWTRWTRKGRGSKTSDRRDRLFRMSGVTRV